MTTRHSDPQIIPQIMSIVENKASEEHTTIWQLFNFKCDYVRWNLLGIDESGACWARGLRRKMLQWEFQHSLTRHNINQEGNLRLIFMFEGEKIGIMKSYIRYSFVLASLAQNSPSNRIPKGNQIIYGPGVPPLSLSVFGCLIVKSETNCILN